MKKNIKFISMIIGFMIFFLLLMVSYKMILGYNLVQIIRSDKYIYLLLIIFSLVVIYFYNISSNSIEKDTKEIEDYYEKIRKYLLGDDIIDTNKEKKDIKNENDNNITSDILELMSLNMKEIKEYYILSKTMAKRSFNLSIVMCILGFIVIASSIFGIFLIKVSFIEALIPVIGGTIVEVIATTTFVVYKKSLEQLNQYFKTLHNNERFLSVVSLVDKMSANKKDDVYINIINSQLEMLKNDKN